MTAVNIDDLKAALAALTPKATSPSGARAIVEAIVEEIRAAMDKGYTYPEIAKLLAEQGLDLKPNTLRLYMQPKKTAHGQRTSRGRKVATGATRSTARHGSASAAGAAAPSAAPPAITTAITSATSTAAAAATGRAHAADAGGSSLAIPGAVRTEF